MVLACGLVVGPRENGQKYPAKSAEEKATWPCAQPTVYYSGVSRGGQARAENAYRDIQAGQLGLT